MTSEVKPKQVFKRQAKITAIHQNKTDCFKVCMLLFGIKYHPHGEDKVDEVEIELSSNQLFSFRQFQKAILRKFGVLVFNQSVEASGVSSWPSHLTSVIGEDAQ